MSYIQGVDRNQLTLPQSLEEMIHEDNPIRVIDAFVDMPDIFTKRIRSAKPFFFASLMTRKSSGSDYPFPSTPLARSNGITVHTSSYARA